MYIYMHFNIYKYNTLYNIAVFIFIFINFRLFFSCVFIKNQKLDQYKNYYIFCFCKYYYALIIILTCPIRYYLINN